MHALIRTNRRRSSHLVKAFLVSLLVFATRQSSASAASPDVDQILKSGKFAEGVTELTEHLAKNPQDDVARFGLAMTQFINSIEQLGQSLSRYGIQTRMNRLLTDVLPEPTEPPSEPITYQTLRQIVQDWLIQLQAVERTLGKIESEDVKLPITIGRLRLRMATEATEMISLIPVLQMFRVGTAGREEDFAIAFDRADVDWLRGYCHLMMAVCEVSLAYDGQGLFDVFAHRIFKYAKVPHPFLLESARGTGSSFFEFEEIIDLIAAIHMLRFPLIEPGRMASALEHVKATLSLSREMWKRILAEADDDREWIPNPSQKGAINVNVTQEMVDQWMVAVDEFESILQGKKLLPFWRGKHTRGVNVHKVFLQPTSLDVVLWIQGTAAIPYLEEGKMTSPETWRQINETFRGQFLGFGFWFN